MVELGFPPCDRTDEPAVGVVFVLGDFGGFPAVEPAGGDAEFEGEFYSVAVAAREAFFAAARS